ncbi:hypothetical protein Bca52824_022510 [Brassica carinata]|uniref:S-protein homolog n=1 Tax=Brassica carinata TaxID=52824 RepID=A0A8X7VG66_BRACI|nr:hypothetical protein Bca52824_022510 [Brassica carinata]
MNHLIIFMLVLAMCSCFKESSGCAPGTTPNTLRFKNQLGGAHVLNVHCSSNRGESKGSKPVLFNEIYSFPVEEKGQGRIVWKCELRDVKSRTRVMIWRAYRGASNVRCGEIREYIAELKGVSLMKNNKPAKEFFHWAKG